MPRTESSKGTCHVEVFVCCKIKMDIQDIGPLQLTRDFYSADEGDADDYEENS